MLKSVALGNIDNTKNMIVKEEFGVMPDSFFIIFANYVNYMYNN